MAQLLNLSKDTAVVSKLTKSSLSTVRDRGTIFSVNIAELAQDYQTVEQGFLSTLRKSFNFWILFYYAIECQSLDDFVTIVEDQEYYILDGGSIDDSILFLAVEYFYIMLFDKYLKPAFDYIGVDFNHTHEMKVIGKEGLVVWINVL